ncbi:hypothetical protein [Serratia sp. M24T3]|uniref:hypothetical protein n=1 Tax=Serratia sp. M24T3 TaxID=932213 RepID=UPI00025B9165|nr:hypothetical protein [Serratia sp. M24T3]EIC84037.1 phage protein [Serratia sp. M24T3]
MSETTELSVIEIKPEQAPAIYVANGLDQYLLQIREYAREAPDVTTKKGRDRIGSLALLVGKSKKLIEEPGRSYLKHLKEAVKPAEEELRRFTRECDAIRDAILKPRAEWEAERERIAAAKAAEQEKLRIEAEQLAAAEVLRKQKEVDHELALLMNTQFDRDAADAQAEAERQRIAHEEEIKRQAVEQARIDAEQEAKREREESAQREAALKLKVEQEERAKIEVEQKAEREKKEASEKVERDKKEALERAEQEKQDAIAAEQRKQQEAEQRRLAEEKRIKDEADKRAANIEHQKNINHQVIAILTKSGISTECAQDCVIAIVKHQREAAASGQHPPVQINY